jgi:SAM-dependent methyltransferase
MLNFLFKKILPLEDYIFECLLGFSFFKSLDKIDIYNTNDSSVSHATSYQPVRCRSLRELIREGRRLNKEIECFVDIGSGEGKACFYACYFKHFKKIIGVELSKKLYNKCLANLKKVELDFTLVNMDAVEFKLPDIPCFIFLFNPFDEQALAKFINCNHSHFAEFPSLIAYANDCHRNDLVKLGFEIKFRNDLTKNSLLAFHDFYLK